MAVQLSALVAISALQMAAATNSRKPPQLSACTVGAKELLLSLHQGQGHRCSEAWVAATFTELAAK